MPPAPAAVRRPTASPRRSGLVDTPLAGRVAADPEMARWCARRQPLAGGMLPAAEVAGLIRYLVEPGSRAVTGQVIAIDGGWRLDQ